VAGFEITPRDRVLLRFAAEQRTFLADHVRALLDLSADATDELLVELHDAGLIERREVFAQAAPLHWISREGLAAVDSPLKPPAFNANSYEHDVGVAFLWLAAHDGTFGPVSAVLGERGLRSSDARREAGEPPLAVRVGGFGRGGRERLHYPDLLLVDPQGRRIGLELELTDKGPTRRQRILGAYAADPRIDAVVYLVKSRRLGHSIAAAAARMGIEDRVYVQLVGLGVTAPGRDAAPGRRRFPDRPRTRSERGAAR
jgi:hypothetical protein